MAVKIYIWVPVFANRNSVYQLVILLLKIVFKGQQKMGWLNSITIPTDLSLSKLWKIVKDREACPWGHRVGHALVTKQQVHTDKGWLEIIKIKIV